MKPSQRSNWYRFQMAALCLLLACSTSLLAQKPAVSTGSSAATFTFATTVGVAGVVQDSYGNYIFQDQDTGNLDIIYAGTSTPVALVTGLNGDYNVHLDNAGNIYVVSAYTSLAEIIPYQNGAYNTANAVNLYAAINGIDGGYAQVSDAIPDNQGNVYVSELYCSDSDSCGDASAFFIYQMTTAGANPVIFYGPTVAYTPVVSMALDQYGNLSWVDDSTGVYTINVNALIAGSQTGNGNCTTLCDTQLSSDVTKGIGIDAGGDLLLIMGQTTAQDFKVIPNVNGAPDGADEYIAFGNFYSGDGAGVSPVSGAIFTGDGGYGNPGTLRTSQIGGASFGTSAVGGGGVGGPATTFAFESSSTFSNVVVVSEGSTSSGEFSVGTGYTACTPGTTYGNTPNDHTCVFYPYFSPAGVGPRSGSIYLTSSTGAILANNHLAAVGLGGQFGTIGGTSSTLISSSTTIGTATLASPSGVAVDGLGNVFIADTSNARIVEQPGAGTPFVFATGSATLTNPKGVAVDGAGDVYIADGSGNQVVRVDAAGNSTVLLSSTTSVSGATASGLNGIAVDGLGNVFVSDTGNNRVLRIPSIGAISVMVPATLQFGSSALSGPTGIAVDGYDDVFIADTGNNRIVELSGYGVASALSTTYSAPKGVAIDAAGDSYVADSTGIKVLYLNGHELSAIPTGLSGANGVALDANANIYVANTGDNNVVELNTSNPSVNLGSETVSDTTSALDVLVYNTGNEPLTFSAAPVLDNGDTIFALSSDSCTNGSTVNPGGVCIIGVTFTPSATGAATGSITLAATANPTATTPQVLSQTISLTGTGTTASAAATTTTLTATPSTVTIGQSVTLKATVASSGGTPTGTVTFSVVDGPVLLSGVTVTDGVASITGPTTGYPAGTYTISASYTPTGNFQASSGTTSLKLQTVAATTTTLTVAPTTGTANQTATLTARVTSTGGTPTGTVTFSVQGGPVLYSGVNVVNGVATLSGPIPADPTGTYILVATYVPTGNFSASSGTASFTLKDATTTTLTSTTVGDTVTLKATVTSTSGTPSGTVSFYYGTDLLASDVPLSGGMASVSGSSSGNPSGSYTLTATYNGSTTYATSSGSANVTVNSIGHVPLKSGTRDSFPVRFQK